MKRRKDDNHEEENDEEYKRGTDIERRNRESQGGRGVKHVNKEKKKKR